MQYTMTFMDHIYYAYQTMPFMSKNSSQYGGFCLLNIIGVYGVFLIFICSYIHYDCPLHTGRVMDQPLSTEFTHAKGHPSGLPQTPRSPYLYFISVMCSLCFLDLSTS